MKQITTTSEKLTKKNIINRGSDVRGGVSLTIADLVAGSVVPEGTPLTKPASGLRTVCKQAVVLTGSTTTVINVEELTHQFKVGNFIGTKLLGKAYAITGIVNAAGVDAITVGTAIDAPVTGEFIMEMVAQAATNTSALKNTANTITKSGFEVSSDSLVFQAADAFVRADILSGVLAPEYLATLPGVIEIEY